MSGRLYKFIEEDLEWNVRWLERKMRIGSKLSLLQLETKRFKLWMLRRNLRTAAGVEAEILRNGEITKKLLERKV
jgi:hypothetical protein